METLAYIIYGIFCVFAYFRVDEMYWRFKAEMDEEERIEMKKAIEEFEKTREHHPLID